MQTASNCPNCNKPTTDADYYWHNEVAKPTKKNPNCKECISKKERQKYLAKKIEMEMYGI